MENLNKHLKLNTEKWDLQSKTFDKKSLLRFYFRFCQKRIVSLLHLKEDQMLLDIGCGTGWALHYAAILVNGNGGFYGVDISPKMIEIAKINSSNCKNIHFYNSDAETLPFENNFFDYIICTNSFHHYLNPLKVLSEIYRVLKDKAKVYILDLTADIPILKMVDKQVKKREQEHVKYYSSQEYKMFFTKAGLSYALVGIKMYPVKIHIGEK